MEVGQPGPGDRRPRENSLVWLPSRLLCGTAAPPKGTKVGGSRKMERRAWESPILGLWAGSSSRTGLPGEPGTQLRHGCSEGIRSQRNPEKTQGTLVKLSVGQPLRSLQGRILQAAWASPPWAPEEHGQTSIPKPSTLYYDHGDPDTTPPSGCKLPSHSPCVQTGRMERQMEGRKEG